MRFKVYVGILKDYQFLSFILDFFFTDKVLIAMLFLLYELLIMAYFKRKNSTGGTEKTNKLIIMTSFVSFYSAS